MAPARSLHEIFAGLTGDAAAHGEVDAVLHANGYADLPAELLTQAVVSYAETAPAELAEHLAPLVMANSPVPGDEGAAVAEFGSPLDLLAAAPAAGLDDDGLDAASLDDAHFLDEESLDEASDAVAGRPDTFDGAPLEASFGHGDGPVAEQADAVAAGPTVEAAEPVNFEGTDDSLDLPDDPLSPVDPWAGPSASDGAAEIDDLM
ncbi:hypothetical protein [Micromonospora sp. NBC_01813]|uniref:hypothetical protein n=1 Tax=Micromonospora sp. NBC_01813 TaxID=2975988 RepID=UPI002DD9306E|nr:hypothetical protein [Micromonospora sp. NBC_01813]WSA06575.1 hypothetical protein OG958_20000 [Micromonospora sp. NBC_01813]